MQENRLRRLGHVLRKKETEAVRLVKEMCIEGMKGRRRQKKRRFDVINSGMKSADVCVFRMWEIE